MAGSETRDTLVSVENVTRSFNIDGREIRALNSVSLTLKRGETLGIVGSSGAGKSTLLQVIGALDRPTTGKVLFEGEDVFGKSEPDLAAFRSRMVGFVFQSSHLLPEFTAEENVALAAMIAGMSKNSAIDKAKGLLGRVGLSERLNHRPGKLSGGEKQRVAIARALINEPKLVLADEPTGNLDSRTGDDVFELLMDMNREHGQTFVIVTHNLDLAGRMSRVLKIKDGKFVDYHAGMLE